MGRKTFLAGLAAGGGSGGGTPGVTEIVFSRTLRQSDYPNVQIDAGDPAEVVRRLKAQPGKDIWLWGGGELFRTLFTAKLVDTVGSERFKLLYDIYHMQVDEGDVIATIRDFKDRIGHYHTAGVPGRNEIDESQELFYPAIMRAIVDIGFKGIVAQEFIPKRQDRYASLEQAVKICDV